MTKLPLQIYENDGFGPVCVFDSCRQKRRLSRFRTKLTLFVTTQPLFFFPLIYENATAFMVPRSSRWRRVDRGPRGTRAVSLDRTVEMRSSQLCWTAVIFPLHCTSVRTRNTCLFHGKCDKDYSGILSSFSIQLWIF